MSKIVATLIAGAVIAGGLLVPVDSAFAAKKKKPAAAKPAAAATVKGASKGVTNIADCAKMDPAQRDACISRSAPVKGADLYKAAGGAAAAAPTVTKAAKAEKPAKAAKAAAGATNINDCAKMDPAQRDACISRSAPVKGADLYAKYKK